MKSQSKGLMMDDNTHDLQHNATGDLMISTQTLFESVFQLNMLVGMIRGMLCDDHNMPIAQRELFESELKHTKAIIAELIDAHPSSFLGERMRKMIEEGDA